MKIAAGIVMCLVFTIATITTKAQTISSFTPLKGPIGSLIKITGTSLNNPTSVNIGGVPAIVISNDGVTMIAMVMPGAVLCKISITTPLKTEISTNDFVITTAEIPTLQQGNKLVGSGVVGVSSQGNAVAVSADGKTAIVGGYTDNSYQGAVWIFSKTNEKWDQGIKLTANDSIFKAQQGYSIALSADGNTAIVGGISDNTFKGAAWIFTRNNGVWLQQGKKLVGTGTVGNAQQEIGRAHV